jgi:hypothetical protein
VKLTALTVIAVLLCSGASAQQADSKRVDTLAVIDTTNRSAPVNDSALVDSIHRIYPTLDVDTLTPTQRNYIEFETRLRLERQAQKQAETYPELSYFDSLVTYLVSPRWNLRADIDRSFYHDAGDYFKSDPGYLVLEPQTTPIRKTVQPYGLSGDRLGFIVDDRQLEPFEHIIEPDGQTDLNDIPTALDDLVAILPGSVGLVFGGRHTAATLLTRPKPPDTSTSISTFLVDKGSFGYSFARGRYSGRFTNGKKIDMSIGYRNADGQLAYGAGDDAYDYTADFLIPVGDTRRIRATGWLYDRKGPYLIRPDVGGGYVRRDRFDRLGQVSMISHNADHTRRVEVGYRHKRQASNIDHGYTGRFDYTGNALFATREWSVGSTMLSADLSGDNLEYICQKSVHSRWSGDLGLSLARLQSAWRLAVNVRDAYVEGFMTLPSVSAMISRDREKSFVMFSAGYSERAPSLHELYLKRQQAKIYGSGSFDYADEGNPGLKSERQIIGTFELDLGPVDKSVGVKVTGGRIRDGIDWVNRKEGALTVFSPANGDVSFATVTTDARIGLGEYFHFLSGGSYHYLDYENFETKPYSPKYQAFSGLELHVFWPQKLIHFWAYGEFVFTGPYDGYVQTGLGKEPVFNVKASFKLGGFRFHWISQNVLSNPYSPREYFEIPGRYNSYGFTWDFFN